jgi:hypothetical protein
MARMDVRSTPLSIWQVTTAECGGKVEGRAKALGRIGVDGSFNDRRYRLRHVGCDIAQTAR